MSSRRCGPIDVVIVEGLIPNADLQIASLLNAEMARSLSANIIPVISGAHKDAQDLAESIALAERQFSENGHQPFAGMMINKMAEGPKGPG